VFAGLQACLLWGTEGLNDEEGFQRLAVIALIFMKLHLMIPGEDRNNQDREGKSKGMLTVLLATHFPLCFPAAG